jgi:large conductance mechanosensitive channel
MLADFRKFILRGNLVELMVGFTVGAAFAVVAKSLVDDIVMPPIGLLLGGHDFSNLFVLLKAGPKGAPPYASLAEAQAAGAVTWNFGRFVNNVITFLIVAASVYVVVKTVNRLEARVKSGETPAPPDEKPCPYCLQTVPLKATRCPHCTSTIV